MYRIDVSNNAVAKPAYSPIGATPGYFQDTEPTGGTDVPAEWLNHYQEELCNVTTGLGGTLSKTSDAVLWGVLQPRVDGIYAHATNTGSYTNPLTRIVIASTSSRASGVTSAVIACDSAFSEGEGSSSISCDPGAGFFNKVSGNFCCNLASSDPHIGAECYNSANIAVYNSEIKGNANECANIASNYCTIINDNVVDSCSSTNLGSQSSTIENTGIFAKPVIGVGNLCTYSSYIGDSAFSANLASGKANMYGIDCGVIAASKNVELHTGFAVAGGYSSGADVAITSTNQNLTWMIESKTGDVTCSGDIRVGDPNAKTDTDTDVFLDAATGNIGAKGGLNLGCTNAETGAGAACTVDGSTGKLTASGGLATVNPSAAAASWDTGNSRFAATLNEVGGVVQIPFLDTQKIPASGPSTGVLLCRVTNSKVGTGSRVHVTIDFPATTTAFPVMCTDISTGYIDLYFSNLGAVDLEGTISVFIDVINPV